MDERPLDLGQLFATLAHERVDYTIIGGVAVQVHGHRRTTRDLDVIPRPEPENLRRLTAALVALEASPRDMPGGGAPSADQLGVAPVVPPLMTRHGALHILNAVPGAAPYHQLRDRALVLEVDEVEVAIASLDDLISMKRAAGRPRDLSDIAALVEANP
ncbi:MAG: DUF6036 family nucleotidyltransferase [Solirubrobacteraceae bacterium]